MFPLVTQNISLAKKFDWIAFGIGIWDDLALKQVWSSSEDIVFPDIKMANVEDVRQALMKAAKFYIPSQKSATHQSIAITNIPDRRKTNFVSFESRLLNSFHFRDPIANLISIAKFVTVDTGCHGCVMIRLLDNELFRIYFRGTTSCSVGETYNLEDFACIQAVINRKREVVQSDEDIQELSLLVQWKPLFNFIPDVVVAIPVLKVDEQVLAVVAIAFKKKLPPDFMLTKLDDLKESLDVLVPYAMTLQALHDCNEQNSRLEQIIQSLALLDGTLHNRDQCTSVIGEQFAKLTACQNVIVFKVDSADGRVQKYKMLGKQKSSQWGCPDSDCHEVMDFAIDEKTPLGWVATHRKGLRINDSSECAEYGLTKKGIHSVGSCFCKNVLCVSVMEHSGEQNLVIELSDKEGGFSAKDFELALLFAQHVAPIHTCSVMLSHREKSSRRNGIVNKILMDIEPVKHVHVEQFISYQQKTSSSDMFTGPFLDFQFSVKNQTNAEMAAGVFQVFNDLNLILTWKIRRTTLIRFILSVQQGYRSLPYHNWQHACSVTHFIYLLIKNLDLVNLGYLTQLECFALVVSGMVHDIDHRGTNNRFQACTNSDLYQLYNTQESIMERHHLAIGISILQREDCNILENLSEDEYKDFVELLTWNVLATDIAKYLQTRDTNFKLIRNLRMNHKDDKLALFSLMMTASDVNDCVKSWQDNLNSVKQILTEFFNQGDIEKELGMMPMTMMDRNKADIPEIEYKFIAGIVMPVYKELTVAFPPLQQCVSMLEKVEGFWEVSTAIFDAPENLELADKLDVLQLPEMKEDYLTKLRASSTIPGVRRFSDDKKPVVDARRATIDYKVRLAVRASIAPVEDFKRMFTEKDSTGEDVESTDIEGGSHDEEQSSKCCGCLRKKSNDPDAHASSKR